VLSTMQDWPLTVASILAHRRAVHGTTTVATAGEDGVTYSSFQETAERAARLAGALEALGVERDDRVATFQRNNSAHVEAYFAVPAMGAILPTLNTRLTDARIAYTANHAKDRVISVDASLAAQLAPLLAYVPTVEHLIVHGVLDSAARKALSAVRVPIHDYDELLAGAVAVDRWADVDEREAAAMCYTTGTTGNPKGVVYSHRSIYVHSLAAIAPNALAVDATDPLLPLVPLFHANGWGMSHSAFLAGAALALSDRFVDAATVVSFMAETRPAVAWGVPMLWADIACYAAAEDIRSLPSLKLVLIGGSAVPESLMRTYADRFGIDLVQGSGMTETSPLATVSRAPRGLTADDPAYWNHRVTAGRLTPGIDRRIVADGEVTSPGSGAVGELEYRGVWVTGRYYGGRYYGDDDPARFNDGWLRTGDVATLSADGYVTLFDRTKDMVKSGGEWISLVSLETALARHPDVVEAVVVATRDEQWGERPLACVAMAKGSETLAEDLRAFLSDLCHAGSCPNTGASSKILPEQVWGSSTRKARRAAQGEARCPSRSWRVPGVTRVATAAPHRWRISQEGVADHVRRNDASVRDESDGRSGRREGVRPGSREPRLGVDMDRRPRRCSRLYRDAVPVWRRCRDADAGGRRSRSLACPDLYRGRHRADQAGHRHPHPPGA
jgi:fatty-acyl-CoA synthase